MIEINKSLIPGNYWKMINLLLLYLVYLIYKHTCLFDNHEFQYNSKDTMICRKCGVIAKNVRK